MAETNNLIKDFKAPSTLGKYPLCVSWKRKIKFERHYRPSQKKNEPLLFL